jgi:AraC family transcriptional regulator
MVSYSAQKNSEISTLLGGSALVTSRGSSLCWRGFEIERRILRAAVKDSQLIDHHFLILWETVSADGEAEARPGSFVPFRKLPGTITTLVPGSRPAVRTRTDSPVVVCSVPPRFLHDLELEMDRRPTGPLRPLHGTNDAALRHLMLLLIREASVDSEQNALHLETLFVELGTRLLFAARSLPQEEQPKRQPLPRHLLRRVLERMHVELDSDLSLSTLAAEAGYSRAHFMRMFKAAVGATPHSHLLELRLRRAQELVASRSTSLIDIALACGFRSHAHFSAAFSRRFGLAPSFYRKTLFAVSH